MITLGATILCASMQGATLQEIEAKKKAEEQAEKEIIRKLEKNKVIAIHGGKNIITELADDIPEDKKKILKQAIYYANVANGQYDKEILGRMLDGFVSNGNKLCFYIMKPYGDDYDIKWAKEQREKILQGKGGVERGYFEGKYGFIDSCTLGIVKNTAISYEDTNSKQY